MWYAAGANAVGGSSGFAPQHIVGLASFVAQYNRVLIDGPRITRPVRREYVYTPAKVRFFSLYCMTKYFTNLMVLVNDYFSSLACV